MSDGLIGVLIGSGITCIGYLFVWLQGRSERKHKMRLEVHLAASEGLGACYRYFGSASRIDVTDEQLADLLASSQLWHLKIRLVSDQTTVESLNAAFECLSKFALSIQKPRLNLRRTQNNIQILLDERKTSNARIAHIGALTEQLREQGKHEESERIISYYLPLLEQTQARDIKLQAELKSLQQKTVDLQRDLLERGLTAMGEFQSLISEALVLLRTELGIKTDGPKFKSMLQSSQARIRQDFTSLIVDFAEAAVEELDRGQSPPTES